MIKWIVICSFKSIFLFDGKLNNTQVSQNLWQMHSRACETSTTTTTTIYLMKCLWMPVKPFLWLSYLIRCFHFSCLIQYKQSQQVCISVTWCSHGPIVSLAFLLFFYLFISQVYTVLSISPNRSMNIIFKARYQQESGYESTYV